MLNRLIHNDLKPSLKTSLVLAMGLIIILFVCGRALLPGKTFFHFDLLDEMYLPYANDVKYPNITDHYTADQVQEFYPLQQWHSKQLRNGHFPLWDPYDQGGLPYYENSVRVPLHPLKFLMFVLPADQVYDLSIVIHFLIAFLVMVYYLSKYKLNFFTILFGATSWAFCGFFANNYPREGLFDSIVLIPLVIILIDNLIQKQDTKSTLFFGAGFGFVLLISEPTGFFIYLLVILSRFIGLFLWERNQVSIRLLSFFVLACIISCLIAAVNILGTAHAFFTSNRGYVGDLEYQMQINWIVDYFASIISIGINTFYPYLLGSKDSLDLMKIFGLNIEYTAYFGFLGFLLIPVAFKTVTKKPEFKWFLILALLVFISVIPWAKPVFRGRLLVMIVFPLINFSVFGLEKILNMPAEQLKKIGKLFFLFSLSITVILFIRHFIVGRYYQIIDDKITAYIKNNLSGYHFERYADWKLDTATRFLDLQFISNKYSIFLIAGLLTFSVLILLGGYLRKQKFVVFASLLCLAPTIYYTISNVHIIDKKKYPPPFLTPGMEVLKNNIDHRRIMLMNKDIHGRLLLIKNQLDEFGINHLNGAGSFYPSRPVDLMQFSLTTHPLNDELGVKYLVWSKFSKIDSGALKNISYNGEIIVGEKIGNPNRCWIVSNLALEVNSEEAINRVRYDLRPMGERIHYVDKLPISYKPDSGLAGHAEIINESENEIKIVATVDKPGLLILSDTWYRGWVAEVDGLEKPIIRVDGALRGVWLFPGKHNIKFMYKPLIFYLGSMLSLSTIFILFIVIIYLNYFSKKVLKKNLSSNGRETL